MMQFIKLLTEVLNEGLQTIQGHNANIIVYGLKKICTYGESDEITVL